MPFFKRLKRLLPAKIQGLRRIKKMDFYADGLGVRKKNLDHFSDPKFVAAWEFAEEGNLEGWDGAPPDVRWRVLVCCWAARNALTLEGDFVECGVNTGLLSMAVCHFLDFEKLKRKFYLYDTFEGIPTDTLEGAEKANAEDINHRIYFDCWKIAQRNFSSFKNATLVRGRLPETISASAPKQIAYLSIDLNSATFERETIEILWDRLVQGAVIVIDDYAFKGHEEQYQMWNEFAALQGTSVLCMPTGQGIIIKPPQS